MKPAQLIFAGERRRERCNFAHPILYRKYISGFRSLRLEHKLRADYRTLHCNH